MPEYAVKLTEGSDWVIKVGHRNASNLKKRDSSLRPTEAAISGTLYKKNKYEVLKHFMGDFIPDSLFLASTIKEGERTRPAEVTLQQRVPQIQLNQLTDQQKANSVLHDNVLMLMRSLRYMYSVVGEANAMSAQGAVLDAKLDLGGVSDFVKSKQADYRFTLEDAEKTPHRNSSPNILVDPNT